MRSLLLPLTLIVCAHAVGQAPADVQLRAALIGNWVGVLEYRDYSEPAGSTKRVDLPTWLTISGDSTQHWYYVYDDGPTKTVTDDETVIFDAAKSTYSEATEGKSAHVFQVKGFETLKDGIGTLQMTGSGTDNDKPAEQHIVFTVRRNLLEIQEEVRQAGSTEPFSFRHLYRMVRATPAIARYHRKRWILFDWTSGCGRRASLRRVRLR